jgi:hypothetical protein
MIQPLILLFSLAASGSDAPLKPVTATFHTVVRPAVIHSDTMSRATRLHNEADRLLSIGNVGGARSVFRAMIAYQDSMATFPGEALWALASIEYGRDRELVAATLLDELAETSARYGRPEWEARALLEAGLIYQAHGKFEQSAARARALKPLISSPAISDDDRASIVKRIAKN